MIFGKLKKFISLNTNEKLLFVEVMVLLFFSKMAIFSIPFKRVVSHLGELNGNYRKELLHKEKEKAREVKLFISMVSGNAAIQSVCLDQALAGMIMLKRRKIPSALYLGVKKNEQKKKLDAHAWIVCGDEILIGGQRSKLYTTVAFFSTDY